MKGGHPKKIQFLVKRLNGFETSGTFAEFGAIYDLEKDMLKDIMPRLSRLTEGIQFAPRHYHSLPGRQLMLIAMEDLKELNYRMVERRIGLDYEHCCVVLRKLGQMHAASMSLAKEDPSLLDKYTFAPLPGSDEKPGILQTYFSLNFPSLCKIAKNWEDFEDISLKLEQMKDNFWDLVPKSLSRRNDGYRVLNHGDIWINNMLFKYNETTGKPTDVLFVDFQGSHFTSPAYDLQYFFSSSPQNWVREHQRDDLLRIYYNAFAATLKNLEYEEIPTFADLEEEMKKKELYGFLTAVFILPLACMEEQSAQGSGHVGLSDEEARKELALIMFSGK
uniref:Putative ecdysteroid kinase n=1 Tax=Lutzomyia longipalpis TaxID=7200 RepID=A0A1B0GJA0_LUTLO